MPRIRVVDLLVSDDTAGEEGGIVVDEAEQGRTTMLSTAMTLRRPSATAKPM
jgi:hypothetical protein